jgi:hypothetical protein
MTTPAEFEERYAHASGTTVEALRQYGRQTAPCYCGEEGCEGWQMAHVKCPDDKDIALSLWRRWADENISDIPPK